MAARELGWGAAASKAPSAVDARTALEQFQDHLAPQLDVYEQAVYLYILRHTRLIGKPRLTIELKSARHKIAKGLGKRGGRYVAPDYHSASDELMDLTTNVSAFIKGIAMVGDNLVVIKTLPGTAHSVGVLLDGLNWHELAGTVAGDDTIFVAVLGGARGAKFLVKRLSALIKKEEKGHG